MGENTVLDRKREHSLFLPKDRDTKHILSVALKTLRHGMSSYFMNQTLLFSLVQLALSPTDMQTTKDASDAVTFDLVKDIIPSETVVLSN